jgi:hypothetical protein
MTTYYIYFFIFAVIGYFIVTDNSVARLFFYLGQFIRLQYEKVKWWLLYCPDNPMVRLAIRRRSDRMAEELMRDLKK